MAFFCPFLAKNGQKRLRPKWHEGGYPPQKPPRKGVFGTPRSGVPPPGGASGAPRGAPKGVLRTHFGEKRGVEAAKEGVEGGVLYVQKDGLRRPRLWPFFTPGFRGFFCFFSAKKKNLKKSAEPCHFGRTGPSMAKKKLHFFLKKKIFFFL